MALIERFYELLEVGINTRRAAAGEPLIIRVKNPDLEREANERALEARTQVGLDGSTPIPHPTEDQMLAELQWPGSINVTELMNWGYLWPDPAAAAVDARASDGRAVGLLNTEPHRSLLMNPAYSHWGAGHYSEFKPGDDTTNPLLERHYWGVWLATGTPLPPTSYAGFGTSHGYPRTIRFAGKVTGRQFTQSGGQIKLKSATWTSSNATAGRRAVIPGQPGVWLYIVNGAYAGYWVPEGTVTAGNS